MESSLNDSSEAYSPPTRPPIIGIIGPKESGKTSVAKEIGNLMPESQRIRFAWPIKAMTFSLLSISGIGVETAWQYVDGKRKEETLPDPFGESTARELMQTLGTEWGREHVGQKIWLEIAMQRAQEIDGLVVVDDVRFTNEANRIRSEGGIILRVQREGYEWNGEHASEASLSGYEPDYILDNNGALENLHIPVSTFLKDIDFSPNTLLK